MFALKFFTVFNILFTFRIFQQLALALKNRVCLECTYWMHIFYHSEFLSSLRLRWETVTLKYFTVLKCFLLFRNFGQLSLALKTEFALKFFKPGDSSAPPPPRTHMGLYYILLGKWQFQNGMNKPCVHWMDCACLVKKLGVTITTKKELTYR